MIVEILTPFNGYVLYFESKINLENHNIVHHILEGVRITMILETDYNA